MSEYDDFSSPPRPPGGPTHADGTALSLSLTTENLTRVRKERQELRGEQKTLEGQQKALVDTRAADENAREQYGQVLRDGLAEVQRAVGDQSEGVKAAIKSAKKAAINSKGIHKLLKNIDKTVTGTDEKLDKKKFGDVKQAITDGTFSVKEHITKEHTASRQVIVGNIKSELIIRLSTLTTGESLKQLGADLTGQLAALAKGTDGQVRLDRLVDLARGPRIQDAITQLELLRKDLTAFEKSCTERAEEDTALVDMNMSLTKDLSRAHDENAALQEHVLAESVALEENKAANSHLERDLRDMQDQNEYLAAKLQRLQHRCVSNNGGAGDRE